MASNSMSTAGILGAQASLTAELKASREIIKDRLYFMCLKRPLVPKGSTNQLFFTTDSSLLYEPFAHDFGPLNLACVYRFCQMVRERLQNPKNEGKVIYYWCSPKPNHRANSAVLMGAYQVIYMGRSAEDAYKPLEALEPFLPFRDAAIGPCAFKLTVRHCLRALEKAMKYRFFDFGGFNLEEYEHFEQVENGDCNIILPGRFLALAGPLGAKSMDGSPSFTPDDYVPILKKFGVSTVIRLNKKVYDRRRFVDQSIAHYDLYFIDGTCPSLPILDRFINICETHKGTIGVHCKAGLGRTGTCIAAYIMKHFRFTAAEAIGWLRICRPGSIIGPQQQFLRLQQPRLWKDGKKSRVALAEELKKRGELGPSSGASTPSVPGTPTTAEAKTAMTSLMSGHTNNGNHHGGMMTSSSMSVGSSMLSVGHHHSNGAHSTPSSPQPRIGSTNASQHSNGFASLHGVHGSHGHGHGIGAPPLAPSSAFSSTTTVNDRQQPYNSITSTTLIGKKDDTLLSMRPIGGGAGGNISSTTGAATPLSTATTTPSSLTVAASTPSSATTSEEKDEGKKELREVSLHRRPPVGATAGLLGDDTKNRGRPSLDSAKLKSGVPLSTVDLKRASDPLSFNGHGSGARVPSDSFIRRSPLTHGGHSSTNHTISSATSPLGLAALRNKKPFPTTTTTTTTGTTTSVASGSIVTGHSSSMAGRQRLSM